MNFLLMNVKGRKVTTKDLWLNMNSQETVGLSPQTFGEFIFPYYAELAKRIWIGLLWLLRAGAWNLEGLLKQAPRVEENIRIAMVR